MSWHRNDAGQERGRRALLAMVAGLAVIGAACGVPTDPRPVALTFKSPAVSANVAPGSDKVKAYFVRDGILVPKVRSIKLPTEATVKRLLLAIVVNSTKPPAPGPVATLPKTSEPPATAIGQQYQYESLADWNARIETARRQAVVDTLVDGVTDAERGGGLGSSLEAVGLGKARVRPVLVVTAEKGLASVILGQTFDTQSSNGVDFRLALAQIVFTLTALPGIRQVVFARELAGGKGVEQFPVQGAQGVRLPAGTALGREDYADFRPGDLSPSV